MKALLLFLLSLLLTTVSYSQLTLKDKFGRNLSGQSIVLVDWEGYMANPAIQLTLEAPAGTTFPLSVSLWANGSRLYFDMPSTASGLGPTKVLTLPNTTPVSFYLSIFPDRDSASETYTLTVTSNLGTQQFPISVIDQDPPKPTISFPILLDYSQDNPAYDFFADSIKRSIVRQAANDWAYFLGNGGYDSVKAGDEQTFIWNDWNDENVPPTGYWTTNMKTYSGFLLYPHGVHFYNHRSGGSPSLHAFQTRFGLPTQLRRSGAFEAEVHGNYNTLGWNTSITDSTWYQATNYGNEQNDFYSIALHELGHALCFNPGYPVFDGYKKKGSITDPAIVAYQGGPVPVDQFDHLSNGAADDALKYVDKVSKKGAFGSEYASVMPNGRWLITKLHLLCLQAAGYFVKYTSALATPVIATASLPSGALGKPYAEKINVYGGVPFYRFSVKEGALPPGLSLNSFNGTVAGTPSQEGSFSFRVRLTDYEEKVYDTTYVVNVAQVFTFTGNGYWNDPANWVNGLVPSVPVPSGLEVVIDPPLNGQCIFWGNFQLQPGAKLTVKEGKSFKVK